MSSVHKITFSEIENTTDTLEKLLKSRGYTTPLKHGLYLTPAPKGSGRSDIAINHDQIFDN